MKNLIEIIFAVKYNTVICELTPLVLTLIKSYYITIVESYE